MLSLVNLTRDTIVIKHNHPCDVKAAELELRAEPVGCEGAATIIHKLRKARACISANQ